MSVRETIQEWLAAHPQMLPYGMTKMNGVQVVSEKRRGMSYEASYAKDALVSNDWRIGGQRGGSCWDEGEHRYESVDGEKEAEFDELDEFLEECFPQLTYIQYRQLQKHIEYHEFTSDSDYYGNYTRSMVKSLSISALEDVLGDV